MSDEILTLTDRDGHRQRWQFWSTGHAYLVAEADRESVLDLEQMTALAEFLHRAIAAARRDALRIKDHDDAM